MNFKSRTLALIKRLENALQKDKQGIIDDFLLILPDINELSKTEFLNSWITFLSDTPVNDIPMTKYGRSLSIDSVQNLKTTDRHSFPREVGWICQELFMYCKENDLCDCEEQYFYFFHLDENIVYKYTPYSGATPNIPKSNEYRSRIALISDLDIPPDELYN